MYRLQGVLRSLGISRARLRPHPAESPLWYQEFIDNNFWSIDTEPLPESLQKSSLLIGPMSTVFIEAICNGVNYVIFEANDEYYNPAGYLNLQPQCPFDGSDPRIPVARTETELVNIMNSRCAVEPSCLGDYIRPKFDPTVIAATVGRKPTSRLSVCSLAQEPDVVAASADSSLVQGKEQTALCARPSQAQTLGILYPEARVMEGSIAMLPSEKLPGAKHDMVIGLGATDSASPVSALLERAFACVKPGGVLVSSFRLTDHATVTDQDRSYQDLRPEGAEAERTPYVVLNVRDFMALLHTLNPAHISGYGYWGKPSSTAVTPFRMVCFAVIAVRKRKLGESAATQIELQLPENLVRLGQ